MRKNGYETLIEEGKKRDYIFKVIREAGTLEEVSPNLKDVVIYPESFLKRKSTDLDGWRKLEKKFTQSKKQRIEEEKQYKQWEAEQKEYEKVLKQKSGGKDWCNPREITLLARRGNVPQDCMFVLNDAWFRVIQQTNSGTLIHCPLAQSSIYTYLVEPNKTDGGLVDDAFVSEGVFVSTGTYQYVNTFGNKKTIYKIKRVQ